MAFSEVLGLTDGV